MSIIDGARLQRDFEASGHNMDSLEKRLFDSWGNMPFTGAHAQRAIDWYGENVSYDFYGAYAPGKEKSTFRSFQDKIYWFTVKSELGAKLSAAWLRYVEVYKVPEYRDSIGLWWTMKRYKDFKIKLAASIAAGSPNDYLDHKHKFRRTCEIRDAYACRTSIRGIPKET